jgi:predicted Rossmann fold nucleotide-binding protein DprA/Smf involved in DNA uptake
MKSRLITKATLLLSARLNDTSDAPRPLSLSEYHQLAQSLDALGLTLAALLRTDAKTVLRPYPGADRILRLLRRVADVDFLLDHWDRLGIWVLGEREPEFPARLRQRLKTACLPLLFGAGPRDTLDQGGLCVVGSRDSPAESHSFAQAVGARAGSEGLVVISSDMRGIDREVISATLASGGRVICVLSDSLEKAVASKRYREALATGRVSLVTPFTPDIRFAVANAMRANRYQYGLSDAAIVVETRQSGGIWSGADENRKHRWVPAFVRTGANVAAGNSALLHLGLLPITLQDIEQSASLAQLLIERATSPSSPSPARRERPDLYAIFLSELVLLDEAIACSEDSVARHFGIELLQARTWLARARDGVAASGALSAQAVSS